MECWNTEHARWCFTRALHTRLTMPIPPVVLELLPVALQPQPNVRLKLGAFVPVTAADYRRKQGRRLQHNGLLYHPSFPGFEPTSWPHVIDPISGYNGDGCKQARVMVSTPLPHPSTLVTDTPRCLAC